MDRTIRLAIVDSQPLFREGVIAVLNTHADMEVVGHAGGIDDALQIVAEHVPDILLLGIELAGDLSAATWLFAKSHPELRIVLLSTSEEENFVSSALKAGVSGYVSKNVSCQELARAIHDVYRGGRYVSPGLAGRILAEDRVSPKMTDLGCGHVHLTAREKQVVSCVGRGMSNKEVARVLSLSDKTVKCYMTSIMQKLGVRNRMQVILKAAELSGSAMPVVVSRPEKPSADRPEMGGILLGAGAKADLQRNIRRKSNP